MDTFVCTPVTLLLSLSDKYPWERYEPTYSPSYGLNSTTTVLLEGWLCNWITYKGCVVLGWIISLCVGPGIEPATFRFQYKVLVTPLPSLRSSCTFPSLSLSFLSFHFLFISHLHPPFFFPPSLSFMAGRPDGSAIKALFSPIKGDPPRWKRKKESPCDKNAPPPDQQKKKKNRQTKNYPHQTKMTNQMKKKIVGQPPPPENTGRCRRLAPASKGHLQWSTGAWPYVQFGGGKTRPEKKNGACLCSG